MQPNQSLIASSHPLEDIARVSYEGQDPMKKMYRSGYEDYFNAMPVLSVGDLFLKEKASFSKHVMNALGKRLANAEWLRTTVPAAGEFFRTIIAMEEPKEISGKIEEGAEFVLGQWGDGFTSPVHGHTTGYMHEEIISGKMMVNTYRMTGPESTLVRLIRTDIVEPGTFVSDYVAPNPDNHFKRQTLIHNFKSIVPSVSLHYLPEHTRDGRDNRFEVEDFDAFNIWGEGDLTQISTEEAMRLQVGEVALIRSANVPEYGDHYIVITGPPIMKAHGLRPQEIALQAKCAGILDMYKPIHGVIALKLGEAARKYFLDFHSIQATSTHVTFPKADQLWKR